MVRFEKFCKMIPNTSNKAIFFWKWYLKSAVRSIGRAPYVRNSHQMLET